MKTKDKEEFLEMSSEDESQSEDDEDGWMITDEVEKDFYKTLSQIKNKDPKIYEKDVKFFNNIPSADEKVVKSKKSTPLTIRDYEIKLAVEKRGEPYDEGPVQDHFEKAKQPTYVEEQESLKKSLKALANSGSEDSENEETWGGLFKKREKTKEEKKKEEEHYKEWLKGQKDSASDEEVERNLKPLRDFWTDPKLKDEDQFLRDYILNKRFLEQDNEDENQLNEEKLLEEAEEVRKQDEYEYKYNHRYEEPDQEFIKRYPRVMENSVRRKNDHRKQVREKVKERKVKEKEKKKSEIVHKKKLKKKEVEEKLEELKKITGNNQLAFENVLEKDFDLNEHEKVMQRLFSEEFYSQDDPSFNPSGSAEIDELCDDDTYVDNGVILDDDEYPNCEDPNFNMDCDYDPSQENPKLKDSRSKRRKDKHRRTTVSQAVSREKPSFDPSVHESFQQYLDEYYGIDCEDFIGDLPCRFKYRQTVPNSYGLTVEEILAADEKELERWCSIKRIQQLRPEFKEKGDINVYKKKATDEKLKRKILPSLFKSADDSEVQNKQESMDEEIHFKIQKDEKKQNLRNKPDLANKSNCKLKQDKSSETSFTNQHKKKNMNKQKLTNKIEFIGTNHLEVNNCKRKMTPNNSCLKNDELKKRRVGNNINSRKWPALSSKVMKHKQEHITSKPTNTDESLFQMSDARLLAYGIKPKKFRNKLKYNKHKS